MEPICPKPEFWATVISWTDGDTAKLCLDTWFGDSKTAKFRVVGLDTPEKNRPKHDEAWHRAEELAPVNSRIAVRSSKPDKYGRWLAEIQLTDGRSLAGVLIEEDLGVFYNGGKKSLA